MHPCASDESSLSIGRVMGVEVEEGGELGRGVLKVYIGLVEVFEVKIFCCCCFFSQNFCFGNVKKLI